MGKYNLISYSGKNNHFLKKMVSIQDSNMLYMKFGEIRDQYVGE